MGWGWLLHAYMAFEGLSPTCQGLQAVACCSSVGIPHVHGAVEIAAHPRRIVTARASLRNKLCMRRAAKERAAWEERLWAARAQAEQEEDDHAVAVLEAAIARAQNESQALEDALYDAGGGSGSGSSEGEGSSDGDEDARSTASGITIGGRSRASRAPSMRSMRSVRTRAGSKGGAGSPSLVPGGAEGGGGGSLQPSPRMRLRKPESAKKSIMRILRQSFGGKNPLSNGGSGDFSEQVAEGLGAGSPRRRSFIGVETFVRDKTKVKKATEDASSGAAEGGVGDRRSRRLSHTGSFRVGGAAAATAGSVISAAGAVAPKLQKALEEIMEILPSLAEAAQKFPAGGPH